MKQIAALALLAASAAHAGDALPIHGAWTGKIGNSGINACFTDSDSHYFYLKHLHGIPLEKAEGEADSWNEEVQGKATGKWKITSVTATQLTGEWIGAGNDKGMPIQLSRLSALAGGDCGPDFYAPIAAANKPRYSNGQIGKLALRISHSPLGESFNLVGSSEPLRKINDYVAHWEEERITQANFCERNGGGGWQDNLTAGKVLANYLLVNVDAPDVYCGGPHTTSSHSTLIFDLATGETVEPSSWLAESGEIEEPLRKLIMKKANVCDRLEPSIIPSSPSATGLSFDLDYPHFHRDCNETIEISYAKLAPFLSQEGKELAQRVRLLSK
ncbi:hypothetical protein ACN9MU_06325 [Pseudoduganella sp. R-32]|uniref:hypothetical protein n=1 Tax=Pseudoduganella sp. R-32 TaxID=3404061 RepID=UPI003CEE0142